jgi:sec-independent protein translocase protein TatA
MGSIGTPEILLIMVIALLLFGPRKLPELGKSLGRAIREFKRASSELQETLEREVEEVKRTESQPYPPPGHGPQHHPEAPPTPAPSQNPPDGQSASDAAGAPPAD